MRSPSAPRPHRRTRRGAALGASLVAVLLLSGCGGDGEGGQADGPALTGQAAEGQELVRSLGCVSCHSVDGRDGVGPTLAGLAGSEVTLEDGTTVTADADYLRRSIEDPSAQVVEGFRPIMPARNLPDDEIDAIVAYLEAIGADSPAGPQE